MLCCVITTNSNISTRNIIHLNNIGKPQLLSHWTFAIRSQSHTKLNISYMIDDICTPSMLFLLYPVLFPVPPYRTIYRPLDIGEISTSILAQANIYICSDNRFGSCPDAILENENSDWEAFWPTNPLNQKGRWGLTFRSENCSSFAGIAGHPKSAKNGVFWCVFSFTRSLK